MKGTELLVLHSSCAIGFCSQAICTDHSLGPRTLRLWRSAFFSCPIYLSSTLAAEDSLKTQLAFSFEGLIFLGFASASFKLCHILR
jgi:hypothetical protein